MGCDYYITKVLQIYYSETEIVEYELERERGYFNYNNFDEDDDNYEEDIKSYINSVLTPQTKPIILYNNSNFNKPITEKKYKTLVEFLLREHKKSWADIIKIIKVEERFERE